MRSGTKLAIVLVAVAAAVAALRILCVPVGSFREGLDRLDWGMSADSVRAVLGRPNRICASGAVDHVRVPEGVDAAVLERVTSERWVYSERSPPDDPPRSPDPACRPAPAATELGFDAAGRLRWLVREAMQTAAEVDPRLGRDGRAAPESVHPEGQRGRLSPQS
ncbi:MAG: hypothetical protein KY397_05160 [Gemmatimonadetes bacterium]|nr:hypothetical protein [Gemmatimonadota bacterium]